jgi:hypothetical protein
LEVTQPRDFHSILADKLKNSADTHAGNKAAKLHTHKGAKEISLELHTSQSLVGKLGLVLRLFVYLPVVVFVAYSAA